jgi:hypothetical protein
VLPVERLLLNARMSAGVLSTDYDATLLGGRITGTPSLQLTEARKLNADWAARNLRIEDALRVMQDGEPKYAGILGSDGRVEMQLEDLPNSLGGSGQVRIEQGKLASLPLIQALHDAVLKKTLRLESKPNDRATVNFRIKPDRVQIQDMELRSGLLTVRGSGPVYYDRKLDLELSATLIRDIEKGLGGIGELIGKLSSDVVKYKVKGVIGEPEVSVQVLNIGK